MRLMDKYDTARSIDATILGQKVTITVQEEAIDKVKAQEYLELRFPNQRPINKAHVDRLTEAMNAGEYIDALRDSIYISDTGYLLNGQHRLIAVTNTEKSFTFTVSRGYPESIYQYLDQSKSRSLRDTIHFAKIRNPKRVASAANLLYLLIEGHSRSPRNEVILRMIQDYPSFVDSVSFAYAASRQTFIPVSVGAVIHFLYTPEYASELEEVFKLLKFGDADIFSNRYHPNKMLAHQLKKEWVNNQGYSAGKTGTIYGVHKQLRHDQLSWIHQALKAYIEGKKTFKWSPEYELASVIRDISSIARSRINIRHDYKQYLKEPNYYFPATPRSRE